MPSREDEYWASEKEEDLRYCSKHKRFYKFELGCQLCYLETSGTNDKRVSTPLEICPSCGQISLFWDTNVGEFECVNLKCKQKITKKDLMLSKLKISLEKVTEDKPTTVLPQKSEIIPNIVVNSIVEESDKAEPELPAQSNEKLVKCLNCLKVSLVWNDRQNKYECLNLKCKKAYSKQQYEEEKKLREAEPKGKAWFGNEYFDPKKKKWRKP
jgi:hypothetical protein